MCHDLPLSCALISIACTYLIASLLVSLLRAMSASEEALAFKQKGNQAFAKHEWLSAIDFYTKAIDLDDSDPVFYCNRCQVNTL